MGGMTVDTATFRAQAMDDIDSMRDLTGRSDLGPREVIALCDALDEERERVRVLAEALTIYGHIKDLLLESGGPNAFGSLLLSAADEHAQGWQEKPHMARWAAIVRCNCEEIIAYIDDLDQMAEAALATAGRGEAKT